MNSVVCLSLDAKGACLRRVLTSGDDAAFGASLQEIAMLCILMEKKGVLRVVYVGRDVPPNVAAFQTSNGPSASFTRITRKKIFRSFICFFQGSRYACGFDGIDAILER